MPNFYYHYCSLDSFRRIIESKEIWLTNMFCTNDSAEHYWLRRMAMDVVKASEDASEDFSGLLEARLNEEDTELYCCCFSQREDSLGQWRAYADNGCGVALGISCVYLSQATKEYGDAMRKEIVEYCPIAQRDLIKRVVAAAQQNVQPAGATLAEEPTDQFAALVAGGRLWNAAARCKHWSFCEEREVRLVYDPSLDRSKSRLGKRRFRSKGDMLIPYYALPLPTDVTDPLIPVLYEIMFGPKSAYKHNERAASLLLEDNGYNLQRVRFRHSEATYR